MPLAHDVIARSFLCVCFLFPAVAAPGIAATSTPDSSSEEVNDRVFDPGHASWSIPSHFVEAADRADARDASAHSSTGPRKGGSAVPEDDVLEDGFVDVTPDSKLRIHGVLRGRLARFIHFWRFIGASALVLTWIASGYPIPFASDVRPEPKFFQNARGAETYGCWLDSAMEELLGAGAVRQVHQRPTVCSPLDVVPKDINMTKFRLILDLRYVNKFCTKFKFSMETLARRRSMITPGCFMFSVDLTSAYHHVEIREEDQQYMGFCWRGKYYVFCCLPFGGSYSPSAFTQLSKQLSLFLRSKGVILLHYLDDYLFVTRTLRGCGRLIKFVVNVFRSAGFLINFDKSILYPCQRITSLGFIVDSRKFTFEVIPERITRLSALILSLSKSTSAPRRQVAKVCGTLQSMRLVLGKVVATFTYFLYRVIDSVSSWRSAVHLTADAVRELRFWLGYFSRLGVASTLVTSARFSPHVILECDASDSHWAGVLLNARGDEIIRTRGLFSIEESVWSSTWREYATYVHAISTLRAFLAGLSVLIRTDSMSAWYIFHRGASHIRQIQELVVKLFYLLPDVGIQLDMEWWPRELGTRADIASKEVLAEWCIRHHLFSSLEKRFGIFSIDRFASADNGVFHNLPSQRLPYCSRYFVRDNLCLGDAFVTPWACESFNWVFPPFNLIERAIARMMEQQARGVLLVPDWPGAAWWPLLFHSSRFTWFVCDRVRLGWFHECVVEAADGRPVRTDSKYALLAILCDCRRSSGARLGDHS